MALVLVASVAAACSDRSTDGSSAVPTTSVAPPATTGAATSTTSTTGAPPVTCPGASGLAGGPATIESSGQTRSYVVAVPPDLDSSRPTPVIFNFHGSGSSADQQIVYSQLPERASAAGYVVVTPDGTGEPRGWSLGGELDPTLVDDLVADLGAKICVDPDRIYAAGISNGSAFSSILACTEPYRIAAAAMVAAEVPPGCGAGTRRSVIGFHGTDDPIVPFEGGEVSTGRGYRAPGALDAMQRWSEHDGCAPEPSKDQITQHVLRRTWDGCADGTSVVFYEIDGGGHTWPGGIDLSKLGFSRLGPVTQEISATDLIVDFFDGHRLGG